jgi:hypothetical protein
MQKLPTPLDTDYYRKLVEIQRLILLLMECVQIELLVDDSVAC